MGAVILGGSYGLTGRAVWGVRPARWTPRVFRRLSPRTGDRESEEVRKTTVAGFWVCCWAAWAGEEKGLAEHEKERNDVAHDAGNKRKRLGFYLN